MKTLLSALAAAALGILCVAGLQLSYLLAQAGESLSELRQHSAAVFARSEAALGVLQGAAVEQRRYYKATGKSLAIATADLARLIENSDGRLERITRQAEATADESRRALQAASHAAHTIDTQAYGVGYEAQMLLGSSREAVQAFERVAQDPAVPRTLVALEHSATNVEEGTAAAAQAARHIRDAVSPRRKSFWAALLRWILPRPSIPVR